MFPDKWLRAKRKMFLECGFFVFSSLTGAEGLWTKTLEKLENCRQDFLFFKWMISLVDDWMSLQTHTCIAELLDIFESVVSVTMKTSSSALTLNWTYENEGTNERSATGHWKCLDEETFIVFTQGGQIKSKEHSAHWHVAQGWGVTSEEEDFNPQKRMSLHVPPDLGLK